VSARASPAGPRTVTTAIPRCRPTGRSRSGTGTSTVTSAPDSPAVSSVPGRTPTVSGPGSPATVTRTTCSGAAGGPTNSSGTRTIDTAMRPYSRGPPDQGELAHRSGGAVPAALNSSRSESVRGITSADPSAVVQPAGRKKYCPPDCNTSLSPSYR
jgi:hypothetical protein